MDSNKNLTLQNVQAMVKSNLANLNQRMQDNFNISQLQDPKRENKMIKSKLKEMMRELQYLSKDLILLSQYAEDFQQKAQVIVPDIVENQRTIDEQNEKLNLNQTLNENNRHPLQNFIKLTPNYPGPMNQFLGSNNSIETLVSLEKDTQTIQHNDQLSYQIEEQIYSTQEQYKNASDDIFIDKIQTLQEQKSKINSDIDRNIELIKRKFQSSSSSKQQQQNYQSLPSFASNQQHKPQESQQQQELSPPPQLYQEPDLLIQDQPQQQQQQPKQLEQPQQYQPQQQQQQQQQQSQLINENQNQIQQESQEVVQEVNVQQYQQQQQQQQQEFPQEQIETMQQQPQQQQQQPQQQQEQYMEEEQNQQQPQQYQQQEQEEQEMQEEPMVENQQDDDDSGSFF